MKDAKICRASVYRCCARYETIHCAIHFIRLYFSTYKTHYHVMSCAREEKVGTL